MACAKKRRFQLIRNLVLGALVFSMLGMLIGGLAQSVIIFMLTGIVIGTPIVVPVWGMFALYVSICGFILLTYRIDRDLEKRYTESLSKKRYARPYGHS